MPNVVVYASAFCPYCRWARALLDRKGTPYTVLDIDQEPGLRDEMRQRSQRRTVPQIFIDDSHIGGFDDLSALDQAGKLDALLATSR